MDRDVAIARVGVGMLLVVLGSGWGCSKGEKGANPPPESGPAAAPSAAAPAPAGGATITGEVKFTGAASANPAIDMSEEPKCKADYPTQPHEQVVVVNPNGTLADVFVFVKSGFPAGVTYPVPSTPVVIDQQGCMYHPRVFGIMVGQPLEIRNSDPLLHNIKAMGKANRPFNISQPAAGMTTTRTFTTPEVMLPFECNVHGWMHAFVGVLPHPFYATTGPAGTFSITGLAPGTYVVQAWHAKYGTREATVTVQGTETKTVDFAYTAK